MKIIEIQGYPYNDDDIRVSVTVMMPGASVIDAMVSVAALFAGKTDLHMQAIATGDNPDYVDPNSVVSAQTADPSPSTEIAEVAQPDATVSRRRRRTAVEMEAARAAEPASGAAELGAIATDTNGSRRRRLSPPAPDPMPINDAEMSKAASNAAEELVKLGEDGPALVQLIIGDYDVKFVGEIPVEKRIEFIEKLQTEVRLAKEEKGAA